MAITQQTDYFGEAKGRNLAQYQGLPRFEALLTSYMQEVQVLENAMWSIYVDRLLQNADIFPLAITVTKAGALGTMQFTYTIAGGAVTGPITSTTDGNWNVPGTPFFVTFSSIAFGLGWNYSIDVLGLISAGGGGGPANITFPASDLLVKLGKLVGQTSYGFNDAIFYLMIQVRIAANRSTGRRGQLCYLAALFSSNASVYAQDLYPACIYLEPGAPVVVSPYMIVQQFLANVVAAGVVLCFAWTGNVIAGTVLGGSIYNPGFVAGPPTSNTGVTASQSPGSIYSPGFTAGPPCSNDGGGVMMGVVQTLGGH